MEITQEEDDEEKEEEEESAATTNPPCQACAGVEKTFGLQRYFRTRGFICVCVVQSGGFDCLENGLNTLFAP